MRLASYVRVSTDDRQDPGLQRAAIERHAQAQGHELIATYEDRGVSGAKASRPGLERLMEDARRRRFEAVVVWRFDRFARSTLHLLQALQFFRGLKIGFVSLTEGIDTTTPVGEMVFTFVAAVAQFERELIRERVKAGLDRAKQRGVRLGRKPRPLDHLREEVQRRRAKGQGWKKIARALKVPSITLRRRFQGGHNPPYELRPPLARLAGTSEAAVGGIRT